MYISMFNARSIGNRKLYEMKQKLERNRWNIVGVAETKEKGKKQYVQSRNNSTQKNGTQNEVDFILSTHKNIGHKHTELFNKQAANIGQ